VNAVAPGVTHTPIHQNVDMMKAFAEMAHLFKRVGTMDEVAEAVLFLASDSSTFITGETISLSGGRIS